MSISVTGTKCLQKFRLHLDEASGLCIRHDSSVLAIGDKEFMVTSVVLEGDRCINECSHWLGDIFDPKETDRTKLNHKRPRDKKLNKESGSQWEGIAADGRGRVFIVDERTCTVVALSSGLDERLRTIALQPAMPLPDNAGPEAIVLLADGRLLAVQQKGPAQLIEFGPSTNTERGPHDATVKDGSFESGAHLPSHASFELPRGDGTLVELHRWRLMLDAKHPVASVNDLAVDPQGRLHAISSLSQCVYELPSRTGNDTLIMTNCWQLSPDMKLCSHRKAEGLAFEADGRPLIAVDEKLGEDNLFLLEALSR